MERTRLDTSESWNMTCREIEMAQSDLLHAQDWIGHADGASPDVMPELSHALHHAQQAMHYVRLASNRALDRLEMADRREREEAYELSKSSMEGDSNG